MTLESGRRLGPYEIVASIGAGGMGEVYSARDTRLSRTVAVKILPAALSGNAQLRQRFEREAKVISSLNHPHICTLFDVGSDSGVDYLVLEHLEGETLDQKVLRGALPLDEVFRYAIEIADALDKAHRRGITHRDLKPSNVMITKSGSKLLDFGLARPSDGELNAAVSVFTGETINKAITTEGTIVGTFQYMAPEQVEGKPADARSDIFAFGALLYEMLTGKRAFDGKSRASVIAAILATDPPPVSDVRPVAPASLDRIVRLCLVKDPDERWQSAHDLKLELERARESQGSLAAAGASRRAARAPWLIAGAVLAGVIGAGAYHYRTGHQKPASIQFQMLPPASMIFGPEDVPATISPDGTKLVVRMGRAGSDHPLWIRSLDSLDFKPLPGTEGAFDAFWSPDGTQIAFWKDRKLQRIALSGGPPTTICESQEARGGTWMEDDTILLANNATGPIMAVPATGGTLRAVSRLDASRKESGHWRPAALPGRRFLYVAQSGTRGMGGVYAASLDSPEVKLILDIQSTTVYARPGWLLYQHDGALFAQKFDASKLEKIGTPIRIVDSVGYFPRWGQGAYHASSSALLAYHGGTFSNEGSLVRVEANGQSKALDVGGFNIDLSRDGSRIAFAKVDREAQTSDIWVHDLRRGVTSRVTFDKKADVGPVWSPDGDRIVYVRNDDATSEILTTASSGAGESKLLFVASHPLEVIDWSPDGRHLLLESFSEVGRSDLVTLDLENPQKLQPFVAKPFREESGRFSPDGKWIAYISGESGELEVYAQPFPPDGRRVKISNGGGNAPRWRRNGKELFYVTRADQLMSVELQGGDPMNAGMPREAFRGVSNDLVVEPSGESVITAREPVANPEPIVAITNWTQRLEK